MGQFIRFWSFWKHESWLAATLSKQQGGSARKIYSITDKGRDRFQEKMLEHPHESWVNSRSRFLIKFFFFSDIEPAKRIKLIEHPLMVCRLRLEINKGNRLQRTPIRQWLGSALWRWSRAKFTGWVSNSLLRRNRKGTEGTEWGSEERLQVADGWTLLESYLEPGDVLYFTIPATGLEQLWQGATS